MENVIFHQKKKYGVEEQNCGSTFYFYSTDDNIRYFFYPLLRRMYKLHALGQTCPGKGFKGLLLTWCIHTSLVAI